MSQAFAVRPRQKELFDLLPKDKPFRHADIKALKGSDVKPFQKQTMSDMLKAGMSNNLLEHLADGGYRRILPKQ